MRQTKTLVRSISKRRGIMLIIPNSEIEERIPFIPRSLWKSHKLQAFWLHLLERSWLDIFWHYDHQQPYEGLAGVEAQRWITCRLSRTYTCVLKKGVMTEDGDKWCGVWSLYVFPNISLLRNKTCLHASSSFFYFSSFCLLAFLCCYSLPLFRHAKK